MNKPKRSDFKSDKEYQKALSAWNNSRELKPNKTANTWGNMLGNVGHYMLGIKDEDLKESPYAPTTGPNLTVTEKYYTRPGMREDVYNDLTSKRVKRDYNHDGSFQSIYEGLKSNGKDRTHNAENAFPNNRAGYKGQYNRGHGNLKGQFNLGRYRTDAGEDDKGKYISFNDTYDWNGFKTDRPIPFYDRIYEDEWNKFQGVLKKEEQKESKKLDYKIEKTRTVLGSKMAKGGVISNEVSDALINTKSSNCGSVGQPPCPEKKEETSIDNTYKSFLYDTNSDNTLSKNRINNVNNQFKHINKKSNQSCIAGALNCNTDMVAPKLGVKPIRELIKNKEENLHKYQIKSRRDRSDQRLPSDFVKNNSIDAWEIHPFLREEGIGTEFYTANENTKYEKGIPTDLDLKSIPVGAIIGQGEAGGFYTEEHGVNRHGMSVVGYDKDGMPMVYDSGALRRLDNLRSLGNWGEGYKINMTNITVPKGYEKYNYNYFKEQEKKHQEALGISGREFTYGSSKEHIKAIEQGVNEISTDLMQEYGIKEDTLFQLAQRLPGLSMQETKINNNEGVSKSFVADNAFGNNIAKPLIKGLDFLGYEVANSIREEGRVQDYVLEIEAYNKFPNDEDKRNEHLKKLQKENNKKQIPNNSNFNSSVGAFAIKDMPKYAEERLGLEKGDLYGIKVSNEEELKLGAQTALAFLSENFKKYKNKYPNLSEEELINLTLVSYNNKGKAEDPNFVKHYIQGDVLKDNYLEKINNFNSFKYGGNIFNSNEELIKYFDKNTNTEFTKNSNEMKKSNKNLKERISKFKFSNSKKVPKAMYGALLSTGLGLVTEQINNAAIKDQQEEDQKKQTKLLFAEKAIKDGQIANNYNTRGENVQSFYMEKGGKLAAPSYTAIGGDLKRLSSDSEEAVGNKHHEKTIDNTNGIKLMNNGTPVAEVEDEEVIKDGTKVFSDQLKPEGHTKTFAEIAKELSKKKGKAEEELSKGLVNKTKSNTLNRNIEKFDTEEEILFNNQEAMKKAKGIVPEETEAYNRGGRIKNKNNTYVNNYYGNYAAPLETLTSSSNPMVSSDGDPTIFDNTKNFSNIFKGENRNGRYMESYSTGGNLTDPNKKKTKKEVQEAANKVTNLEFDKETANRLFEIKDEKSVDPNKNDLNLGKYKGRNFFKVKNQGTDYVINPTKVNPQNAQGYKEQMRYIKELNPNATISNNNYKQFTKRMAFGGEVEETEEVEKGYEYGGGDFGQKVAPYLDNVANLISTMTKPKPPKPILTSSPTLNTKVNVSDQLSNVKNSVESASNFIKNNSSNSNTARANVIGTKLKGSNQVNSILASKENQERDLENRASQIQVQNSRANNSLLNRYNEQKVNRNLAQNTEISQNVANAVTDYGNVIKYNDQMQINKEKNELYKNIFAGNNENLKLGIDLDDPTKVNQWRNNPSEFQSMVETQLSNPNITAARRRELKQAYKNIIGREYTSSVGNVSSNYVKPYIHEFSN